MERDPWILEHVYAYDTIISVRFRLQINMESGNDRLVIVRITVRINARYRTLFIVFLFCLGSE